MTTSGGEIWSATPPERARQDSVPACGEDSGHRRSRVRLEHARVELDRRGEARRAHVGDAIDLAERLEQLAQDGLERRGSVDEPFALDDVEVHEPRHAGARMPAYVPPWRNGAASSRQNGSRTRPEATTALSGTYPDEMPFAQVIRSGVKPYRSTAEPLSEPSEARDHLVADDQDVALATDPLDLGQ